MKIIRTDNFCRDYIPDTLIEEGLTEEAAKQKVEEMNDKCDSHGPVYFMAVADDYVLQAGFEP